MYLVLQGDFIFEENWVLKEKKMLWFLNNNNFILVLEPWERTLQESPNMYSPREPENRLSTCQLKERLIRIRQNNSTQTSGYQPYPPKKQNLRLKCPCSRSYDFLQHEAKEKKCFPRGRNSQTGIPQNKYLSKSFDLFTEFS